MQQIIIRNLPDDLSTTVQQLAKREQLSLNKAAQLLMRRGSGLPAVPGGQPHVADALAHYAGSLEADEAQAIQARIDEARRADLDRSD